MYRPVTVMLSVLCPSPVLLVISHQRRQPFHTTKVLSISHQPHWVSQLPLITINQWVTQYQCNNQQSIRKIVRCQQVTMSKARTISNQSLRCTRPQQAIGVKVKATAQGPSTRATNQQSSHQQVNTITKRSHQSISLAKASSSKINNNQR